MNNNEPIILGKIKKGKTGKPLIVLIIFLIIGVFVFAIPTINDYFEGYDIINLIKEGKFIDFIKNKEKYINKNEPTTTQKINEEETKYINKLTILEYNNFNINNFVLTESNISYTINTTTNINFDKSNYYLILTKDTEKIIIKLTGTVNGNKEYSFQFLKPLSSSIDVTGKIEEIKNYTDISLSKNELGISKLTCIKEDTTINYYFNNNKLINIEERILIDNNTQNYTPIQNNVILLGGTSEIIKTTNGDILINYIDLNAYKITQNTNYNYYSLNTEPNKINFEMEAKGFDCK